MKRREIGHWASPRVSISFPMREFENPFFSKTNSNRLPTCTPNRSNSQIRMIRFPLLIGKRFCSQSTTHRFSVSAWWNIPVRLIFGNIGVAAHGHRGESGAKLLDVQAEGFSREGVSSRCSQSRGASPRQGSCVLGLRRTDMILHVGVAWRGACWDDAWGPPDPQHRSATLWRCSTTWTAYMEQMLEQFIDRRRTCWWLFAASPDAGDKRRRSPAGRRMHQASSCS